MNKESYYRTFLSMSIEVYIRDVVLRGSTVMDMDENTLFIKAGFTPANIFNLFKSLVNIFNIDLDMHLSEVESLTLNILVKKVMKAIDEEIK